VSVRPRAEVRQTGAPYERAVDVASMRAFEQVGQQAGHTALMRAAGAALSVAVRRIAGPLGGRAVLAMVGPGDNGGDALILARHLAQDGATVVCWGARERQDDPLVEAARAAGARWTVWNGDARALEHMAQACDVVIDGLLGIGSGPPLRGTVREMLAALSRPPARYTPSPPGRCGNAPMRGPGGWGVRPTFGPTEQLRIAVDLPSGTHADTGAADGLAFRATHTLSTGPVKLGTLLHPAIEFAGVIEALAIGLPEEALRAAGAGIIDQTTVASLRPARTLGGHKGTFGRVVILGGSTRYRGAPALAARAAIGAGAGLVSVAAVEAVVNAVAGAAPEATFRPLEADASGQVAASADHVRALLSDAEAAVVGPGLGRSAHMDRLLTELAGMASLPPLVLDADALNALAEYPAALQEFGQRAVLTPHPGELRRLLRSEHTPDGLARLTAARELEARTGAAVAAKGSPTFVCAAGQTWVLARPNPALAYGGTGDVLAGAIAGLLAQGLSPAAAARLAVWLHARAAELAEQGGMTGLPAEAVAHALPAALHELAAAAVQRTVAVV